MFKAENLCYSLKNGRKILDKVCLELKKGEICGIIGPNGAGKTTLIKILAGVSKPCCGNVLLDDVSIADMTRNETAMKIAYLPQTTNPVPCSVYESVLIGRKPYMKWGPNSNDKRVAKDVMADLGISHMQDKCVTELSGGEFQKTLIARALVQNADVLMLDEPINHLDVKNQIEIMEITKALTAKRNLATLIVMHDLNLALRYTDRLILLNGGSAVYNGETEKITGDSLSKAYNIDIAVRKVDGKSFVVY